MDLFASYTGSDFLAFYAVMLVTCVFLGIWIPANLRDKGRYGRVAERDEVAVLTGGKGRFSIALVTDLFAQGALSQESNKRLRVAKTEHEGSEAEQSVLREIGSLKLGHIQSKLDPYSSRVESDLIARGLLLDQSERLKLRALSVLPYAVLFLIGLYRQQAGDAVGEPTGFLIMLLAVTAFFAVIRFARFNPRTMAGNEAFRAVEEKAARMRTAPTGNEAGFAVAVFGTAVLVGTPWEPVHAMRGGVDGGGGGDSSDSGDGGDGGGCGGGCGGCGG
ncbi:MAG: TIGR04222 domain-containing membrane protein [Erythrobacter sp.]